MKLSKEELILIKQMHFYGNDFLKNCIFQFNNDTIYYRPFKLSYPKKEDILKNPKKPFEKGGDWGDRKEKINDLLAHMI